MSSSEELLIYYEHEIECLRARILQQNRELNMLAQHLQMTYELSSNLEYEYNSMKKEYEKMKLKCIHDHVSKNNVIGD